MTRGGRPASSIGMLSPDSNKMRNDGSNGEDGEGEWVTVVSKFHFVDLAGSERVSLCLCRVATACLIVFYS